MERAKPLVPRQFERSVVTFKITVVHLVMERPKRKAVFVVHQQSLKSRMRGDCGQEIVLKVKDDVQRVGTDHKVDQDRSKKDHLLDRML